VFLNVLFNDSEVDGPLEQDLSIRGFDRKSTCRLATHIVVSFLQSLHLIPETPTKYTYVAALPMPVTK
jgi:hypothetical protein